MKLRWQNPFVFDSGSSSRNRFVDTLPTPPPAVGAAWSHGRLRDLGGQCRGRRAHTLAEAENFLQSLTWVCFSSPF